MHPEAAKRLRLLASAISVLLLVGLLAAGGFYWRLRSSLPQLEGTVTRTGASAPVTLARDAAGVPTIRGANRADVARGLGWLHAQERFFQMDLLRRNAAGELAELFGPRAVARDQANRLHRFRQVAGATLRQASAAERTVLTAYTAGVNAGLAALGAPPFEYVFLRATPRPWTDEDTFLVAFAMWLDLQDETAGYERSLKALRDTLGEPAVAFFAPTSTPEDAALDGSRAPLAPIPGPRVVNLRNRRSAALPPLTAEAYAAFSASVDPVTPGSNALALAGARTAGSGGALLASDMHLSHGVPNIWYRAVLEFGGRRVVGVTLPGVPVVVVGSNGDVAWGFTVAYADTVDLVEVGVNSISRQLYTAPGHDAMIMMEKAQEIIRVKGGDPVTFEFSATVWGPLVGTSDYERPLALRWVAHDPQATNLGLLAMEEARTVDEAIGVAHRVGVPALNLTVADRRGDIAWTIAGRVPKRVGFDGRLPVSWSFGDRKWDGYLTGAEIPVVRGADSAVPGTIWSANQRHIGGDALARLGDGAYRRAARAAQLRDRLAPLQQAKPQDLLALQLDDRALFLARWHALLLRTLTPAATDGNKGRTALRRMVEKWEGRATPESVSYRLVREFRIAVLGQMLRPLFAPCVEEYPEFNWMEFQLEPAVWALLEQRPEHFLPLPYARWDDLLLAACDTVVRAAELQGGSLSQATWGAYNTVRIRHPFSYSMSWLARWLDLPAVGMPGGDDMPRAQSRTNGASQRLVVSPGREDQGLFHMPGGQSGHPLAPNYRTGFDAWARGDPTPLLPGPTTHTLTLQP
jgi:penicillin amidase